MTDFDSTALENAVTDDSTVLDDRDARALTEKMTVIGDAGAARHADDVYSVTTESGCEYTVDLRDGSCTCPDAMHRDVRCKHQRRVAFAVGARPIPAWADTDAIDPQLGAQVQGGPQVAATDGGVIDAGDEGVILEDGDAGDDDVACECDDLDGDLECARCAIATSDDGRFFWEG